MFLQKPHSIVENPGASSNQPITQLLIPLVIAFLLFGFVGFTDSSHASAHASTNTCGNQVRSSSGLPGYFGTDEGTMNLVQNTCTGLFHAEIVCHLATSVEVYILVIVKLGVSQQYNTVTQACTTGQAVDTTPLAYKSSLYFCAWGAGWSPNGDAGGSNTCITHK